MIPSRALLSHALAAFVLLALVGSGQRPASASGDEAVVYDVSLDRRDHHELVVEATFTGLSGAPLEIRMSRTSPGRYALHEFVRNVYDVEIRDGGGRPLTYERPDLHQWTVAEHDGTVRFRYVLFGDLTDGTFSGIDASHAHLNIPATFVWARDLLDRPVEVRFVLPESWTLSSQMTSAGEGVLRAPDFFSFVDSPIEASRQDVVEWNLGKVHGDQTIVLAVHHLGTRAEVEVLAAMVENVVAEQVAIFGEAPRFDDGRYVFLVDALDWAGNDGMEHRNSTVITTAGSLEERIDRVVGTASHEFLHAWNIERLRPRSLQPFDFERANVSGELWFGEGFTSYLDDLVVHRAGGSTVESFAERLGFGLSGVLNAPGIRHMSPVEVSRQAPLVDDATSYAPTNRRNTFVSYYSYGAILGLGLDLELRTRGVGAGLDGYLRAVWERFGRDETPYDNADLERVLADVSGDSEFATRFFADSVHGRTPPDFGPLLAEVGLLLRPAHPGKAWIGGARALRSAEDGEEGVVVRAAPEGSPLFRVGVGRGDRLLALDGRSLDGRESVEEILGEQAPGDVLELRFEKRGEERTVELALDEDPALEVVTFEAAGETLSGEVRARREQWLAPRRKAGPEVVRYCPETGQPHPYRFRYCPAHGEELVILPPESETASD